MRSSSGRYALTMSSVPATWSAKAPPVSLASTNTQPCQSTTCSGTSPNPDGSNSGSLRRLGALRSVPSSRYVHEWYGQTMLRRFVEFAAGEQFVPAVPAGVGESVDRAVFVAGEQHAAVAHRDRALRAGFGQIVGIADAHPRREDVALLPLEDRRIDVGDAGEHAGVPERRERSLELVGRDRRSVLIEHTVSLERALPRR